MRNSAVYSRASSDGEASDRAMALRHGTAGDSEVRFFLRVVQFAHVAMLPFSRARLD
jgi:hypothetical protein